MPLQRALRAFRAACLFAAFLVSLVPASSAAPRWVQATPFGGPIRSLAQAPSAPQVLYAVSLFYGRLFRSLDGGATWRLRPGRTGEEQIYGVVVDSGDPRTVYAATGSGIFRTHDGGLTWVPIESQLELISALVPDNAHPGALFAGTRSGLYRSTDGGDSWALVGLEGSYLTAVAIDSRDPDTIFAAVDGFAVEGPTTFRKSTDGGATWTSLPLPENTGLIFGAPRFVFDPARPEVLYLFIARDDASGPVLRSTDGGASWTELAVTGIRDLAAAPDGTLLVATDYGLARSSDLGTTWVPELPAFPAAAPRDALTQLLVSAAAPGELFAAGNSGVWKSRDNGASWAGSNHGILAQGTYTVAVSPAGAPTVFTITGGNMYRSPDRGATWTRLHSSVEGLQPFQIAAFDLHDPRTVYGIGSDGQSDFPLLSANRGRTWSKLSIPYSCDFQGSICEVGLGTIVLDPDDPDFLLIAGSYYFHFQGPGNYLLRSENRGRSWKKLKPLPGLSSLAIDPRRRDTYYGLSCEGFFQSVTAGRSWQKTGSGLPPRGLCGALRGPVLAIDPQDPRRFYVGTMNQGVFASSDGGATFRAMNRGLETAPVVTLLIDPADSNKLYAGVPSRGVFQWDAEQRKWKPLNAGLPLGGFDGVVALDPQQPSLLYAANSSEGVFRLDLEAP